MPFIQTNELRGRKPQEAAGATQAEDVAIAPQEQIAEPQAPVDGTVAPTTGGFIDEGQLQPRDTAKLPPQTAQERAFQTGPQDVEEEGADLPVGALVGGTIGGIVGAPAGPVGAVGGAALGAAGGEAIEQLVRRATGLPAPETSLQAAKQIGKEAVLGGVGEGVGRLAVGVGGRAFRAIKPRPVVTAEAERAIKFLDTNLPTQERSRFNPFRYLVGKERQAKLTLLPAEANESRAIDLLHNASEASILGGQAISGFKKDRNKALINIADDIIDFMGDRAEPDIVGELFVKAANKELKVSRVGAKIMYNTVDNLAGDTRVPIGTLKGFAEPLQEVAQELKGIGGAAAGDPTIAGVLDLGDDISFSAAKELRSRLIDAANEFSVTNPKAKIIGKTNKLVGLIDTAMEKSLKDSGQDEALRILREANRLWKDGSEKFDNEFVRRLIKKGTRQGEPEAIVKAILKDKAVSNIRRAKVAVGGANTPEWKKIQSHFVQDLFARSTKKGTGELTGPTLTANLTKMGKQSLREIYTPGQLNKIQEFANALSVIQAKQADGTGRMFIQLTQAGALVSIPFGSEFNRLSATILLGPGVLAKAFTNPKIADVITRGVKAGTKTKVAAGALGRFIADVTAADFAESPQPFKPEE